MAKMVFILPLDVVDITFDHVKCAAEMSHFGARSRAKKKNWKQVFYILRAKILGKLPVFNIYFFQYSYNIHV